MVDQSQFAVKRGVRSLTAELLVEIDERYDDLLRGSRYAHVRPFDGRVFVAVSREKLTESDIARAFSVTRQAVHAAVERLIAFGVLERRAIPGNRRDKRLALTERGILACGVVNEQVQAVETECAEILGAENYRFFREQAELLKSALKLRSKTMPQA
jgi:DNA-binding MarR family transcriptional regulator